MNCSAYALYLAELGTLFIMPSVYSPGIPHTAVHPAPPQQFLRGVNGGLVEWVNGALVKEASGPQAISHSGCRSS